MLQSLVRREAHGFPMLEVPHRVFHEVQVAFVSFAIRAFVEWDGGVGVGVIATIQDSVGYCSILALG